MNIREIIENKVIVSTSSNNLQNILNHYVFLRDNKLFVGEIVEIKKDELTINLLGEIINNNFTFGISNKPSINASIELINTNLVPYIISYPNNFTNLYLGKSPIYENIPIYINLNTFFNSHFTILGNTGSGKSSALSRIIQTLFAPKEYIPYNANLLIFDTYGEYYSSFLNLEKENKYISFKSITTNPSSGDELLRIPPHLLGIDDLAILLNADTTSQLQVLEKALELVNIFKRNDSNINKIKNDIIARAILEILLSGRPSFQIRDQIFSILSFYNTNELNLETEIVEPGYTRALKNCLLIDSDGKIKEMELLTKFFTSYLINREEITLSRANTAYTLEDLENAIDFALICEGILKSEKIYDTNNLLKVRLHNLIEGGYKKYFDYPDYISKEDYIRSLIMKNGKKAQIVNFNINYVDDRFGKNIVKILTKMVFDISKVRESRGTNPYHIILEEAHRYVNKDNDVNLLGYNIFERISKEGRKYGVLLGLITQRPSELSETVMSQCNNYLVFKISHPKDVEYIKKLIPYMDNDILKRVQTLQPGNCYAFGPAFKMPMIIKLDKPDPSPTSNNVDIISTWFVKEKKENQENS